MRPLKNTNICLSSRKAIILTTGIHRVFRGLKFEPDTGIGQKRTFCKGLEVCMETERRRAMARIQGQVVGGAVESVSHSESKFLSLSFSARSI